MAVKRFAYRANIGLTEGQYTAIKTIARVQKTKFSSVFNDLLAEVEPVLVKTAEILEEMEKLKDGVPQTVADGLHATMKQADMLKELTHFSFGIFGDDLIDELKTEQPPLKSRTKKSKNKGK